MALCLGLLGVSRYQKKHSTTHTNPDNQTSFINFLIYYDPQHPHCSVYVLGSCLHQRIKAIKTSYEFNDDWIKGL